MTLSAGDRLGRYEILAPVGAGGMGVVYRAHDTELGRDVAVKVLPEELKEDPQRLERFEREAKTISHLSHSHICTLFDVGRVGGIDFLVMEYLEGETLAERLKCGAMPIHEVIPLATQIVDALDHAHRAGIIHRDLKPSNIMLTREGAKLLDFGLAKAQPSIVGAESSLSASPTESYALTTEGSVLGTFEYMAPEQLEGKQLDPRADIFAFGAILYEMATGVRPFGGASAASVIASIMHQQPEPISSIQPKAPPALERVIQGCLEKAPDDRWQTAHDVKLQLRWINKTGPGEENVMPTTTTKSDWRSFLWAAVAAVAIASTVLTGAYLGRVPDKGVHTRLQILPPVELASVGSPRISPDGRFVAFQGVYEDGETDLWIRPMDSLEAYSLPGTQGMQYRPIWSPDSRQVAFFADGKLKKTAINGGLPRTICIAIGADGTWSESGVILYDWAEYTPIHKVSANGGTPQPVVWVDAEAGQTAVAFPEFLPDGQRFIFLRETSSGAFNAVMGSLDSDQGIELMPVESVVRCAEPGHLLFVRGGTLMAQSFDYRSGELTGDPVAIADDVGHLGRGIADFSISNDGTLVYRARAGDHRQLVWRDRTGEEVGTLGDPGLYGEVEISPQGDRVVARIADGQSGGSSIVIFDLEHGAASRLTFGQHRDVSPIWLPDGERIVFSSDRTGSYDLYVKHASGATEAVPLRGDLGLAFADGCSRDEKYFVFAKPQPGTSFDIWAMPLDGSDDPVTVVEGEFYESWSNLSPDGRWLAYQSDESGRNEVYVQSFPGPGGKWQVSDFGGARPRWSGDGREIFYLDPSGKLVSVAVEGETILRLGRRVVLFDTALNDGLTYRGYAVAPDGQRFLVNSPVRDRALSPITVVQNWAASINP